MLKRLSQPQIRPYRLKLIQQQGGLCALCKKPLSADQAALDHCHKTGYVRAALHKGCNTMLGKIENHMAIALLTEHDTLAEVLQNVVPYIQAGLKNEDNHPMYPSFKTEAEKKDLAKRRAAKRRQAAKEK